MTEDAIVEQVVVLVGENDLELPDEVNVCDGLVSHGDDFVVNGAGIEQAIVVWRCVDCGGGVDNEDLLAVKDIRHGRKGEIGESDVGFGIQMH